MPMQAPCPKSMLLKFEAMLVNGSGTILIYFDFKVGKQVLGQYFIHFIFFEQIFWVV